jgi:hypothetical protein
MRAPILAVLAVVAATSTLQAKSSLCPDQDRVCQWQDPKAAAAERKGQCPATTVASAPGGGYLRVGQKCGCPPFPLIPQHQGKVVCKPPG